MPWKPGRVPSYRLHKPSGQARVIIDGEHLYLGAYGSPESHEKYARLIAELAVKGRAPANGNSANGPVVDPLVCELVVAYMEFAKGYYVKDGAVTKEVVEMKLALRPVLALYANERGRNFGPLALQVVRQRMVDSGLSRKVVNHRVNRIRRFFKWAVRNEFLPPSIYEGLRTVDGLVYGRTTAKETEPVKPVPREWIEGILPYVSPTVAAMIQVQSLAGTRPCEVCLMRPCDIDMTGDVWIYEPHDHKNRWRGHKRLILLGPKAQAILLPFLNRAPEAYVFSPRESETARNADRKANRKSPMTPSQAKRRPKRNPKRAKRERYDTDSYRRAITYGINMANKNRDDSAKIPFWYPLQIRHARATEVRKQHGLEAAQVSLGHKHADITQVYAERDFALAIHVAKESG